MSVINMLQYPRCAEPVHGKCYSPFSCSGWGYCRNRNVAAGGMKNVTPAMQAGWREHDTPPRAPQPGGEGNRRGRDGVSEEPKGDREQWDEQRAVECDRMVDSYAQMLIERTAKLQATLTGGTMSKVYAHLQTESIHSIATQMHTWHVMAENLRRSRRIRIEQEAYRSYTP